MGEILTPGNIIVFVIVAIGLIAGVRRAIGGLTKGESCCTSGTSSRKVRAVKVTDTDEAHYPYAIDLPIGGMSCEGCAANVANALNAIDGTWATVDLAGKTAHVRAKHPIDVDACEAAVRDAGYYVAKP
ncbi:heavy-metal-associated domain-containing protein [Collinsella tanakaei]|uniref:heavy-metal-associated domain-containing protein n=1 Tax=Collinsella tanakaei TaxID=626935 RepID=UPI00195A5EF9|nr:heavy metal-associated domain-containing protein [Collinsella tanakaei]MBM6779544.1 heavy-metal-associated domain-containing protein [Collinsella tanakaei]